MSTFMYVLLWVRVGACIQEFSIEQLIKQANSPNDWSRFQAVQSLRKVGGVGPRAVASLVVALDDEDGAVRSEASEALIGIGKPAVADLAAALKKKKSRLRYDIAYILARIGSEAQAAVPSLKSILDDDDYYTRYQAAVALVQIDPEDKEKAGVPILLKALKHERKLFAYSAAEELARIPSEAGPALPLLMKAIDDKYDNDVDWEHHFQAGWLALWSMGNEAKSELPGLVKRLQGYLDKGVDSKVLVIPCGAILQLDPNNKLARELLTKEATEVIEYANAVPESWSLFGIDVIWRLRLDSTETRSTLERLEKDRNPRIRRAASAAVLKLDREKK